MARPKKDLTTYRRARSSEQKGERRELILRVAAAELARMNLSTDFTMEALSKKAGLAKGTVYLYFKNQNALFFVLLERAVLNLLEDIHDRIAALRRPSVPQKVAYAIRDALIRSVNESRLPFLQKSLSEETNSDECESIREEFHLKLRPHMQRVDDVFVQTLKGSKPGDGREVVMYAWPLLIGFSEILHHKPPRLKHKPVLRRIETVEQGVGEALTLIIEGLLARPR